MPIMRSLSLLALAAAVLCGADRASAFTAGLTSADVGSSFSVSFDGNVSGASVDGLTGEAVFTLSAFDATSVTFDITLTNTSSAPISASRISAIGFDITPDAIAASAFGDLDVVVLGGSFPNGFGSIGLCIKSGQANNCSGGGSGGPQLGETYSFSLQIEFGTNISMVELSNFGVRYQSIDSDTLSGASGTGTGTGGPVVPEPHAALVFALGGLLVARHLRQQRGR